MDRDLLKNPYGRFYHIANNLSEAGHQVVFVLFSYKYNENESIIKNGFKIISISIFPNPFSIIFKLRDLISEIVPDWTIGFSDTYYGILAVYISGLINKKSLIDAYDNYESYISFAKPLHWMWRKSLEQANIVTCAGPSLKVLISQYRVSGEINILPMTVDPNLFFVRSRKECRKKLGLPLDVKLIGFHGSISETRDVKTLFSAAKKISHSNQNIKFVISGRKDKNIVIPSGFIYKGYLPDSEVPLLINSLDVLIVTNKNSKFGNYSYPVKLYEAMACNVPVVVSKTKSTEWIMNKYPEFLINAEDELALIEKVNEVINLGRINYEKLPTWKDITNQLSHLIENG